MSALTTGLLEAVNRFHVRCEGCDHYYQTVLIAGLRKLLHAKVALDQIDSAELPTKQCRLAYDFVRFDPCNHCCPEVFELCPESHMSAAGRPTGENCSE
jgi:hypothetical protein